MYFISHTEYVGPRPDLYLDTDKIEILIRPGRANLSREVVTDGWRGETSNWSRYAHGAYDTLRDAVDAVDALWPEIHAATEWDPDEWDPDEWDPETGERVPSGAVAWRPDRDELATVTWRPGRYALVTTDGLDLEAGLDADTTDAEIAESAAAIETSGNIEGWSYAIGVDGLAAAMRVIRDGLRDEVAR